MEQRWCSGGAEGVVTVEAAFGKLAQELRRLNEVLGEVRLMAVEDRPGGEGAVVADTLGDAVEDLLGRTEQALGAAQKVRDAIGERVNWRVVRRSLSESQRSFHHALQGYNVLVSHKGIAELMELGRGGREWGVWVQSVRRGLEGCRVPLEAVAEAYLECWEEIAER